MPKRRGRKNNEKAIKRKNKTENKDKNLLYKGDSVWKGRSIYLPSAKAEW